MKEFIRRLERSHDVWLAISLSFFFFLLRLPSLFEPYWYGDEGIYQTIGQALIKGRILYTQIWDNKPPLLYYTYALVNSDQFFIRLLSLIVGIATVIVFFILARKLFTDKVAPVLASGIFLLLFGLPTFEGNIANAENFMLLPIITAGLILYKAIDKSSQNAEVRNRNIAVSGILLGIAFLYKIVAVFDFAAFFSFMGILLFTNNFSQKNLIDFFKKHLKNIFVFSICFFIPFGISIIYFLLVGALQEYVHAVFQSTVGYVGYKNAFIIPQGLLISKVILVGLFVIFLFVKRNSFTKTSLFILLWTAFSLFNSFFSQRPYTHYLLVLIPSLALLFGQVYAARKKHIFSYAIITISISALALNYFNHWDLKGTIKYYSNFIQFTNSTQSISDYNLFFDKKTVRDNEIVNYINSHKNSSSALFVWGNSAQLYPQTKTLPPGRFTVAYHISGISPYEQETKNALEKNPPQFIVILDDVSTYPFTMYNYSQVLRIENATIYERTY